MKITLKCTYITGRPDIDRNEYVAGTVLDLPKAEAERLINAQHAMPWLPDADVAAASRTARK